MAMFAAGFPAGLSRALQQPLPQPMPPKPSFFGEGGTGRAIAGTIGDALLQANRMDPIYAPAMQQQRAMQQRQMLEQQQQASDWQRWVAQEAWKRNNPEPEKPTALQQNYEFFKSTLGPETATTFLKSEANPLRWITATNADGTQTVIPVGPSGPLTGGGAPVPQQSLPPDFFDNGGASPSGSRPFR